MPSNDVLVGTNELVQAPILEGVAVRVRGRMVAWFTDAEAACAWATEHHFGQWLVDSCSLPDTPSFTAEQLAAARVAGEELLRKIRPGRTTDA
jgi:hypothetical protein